MRRRIWLGILFLVITPPIFAQPTSAAAEYISGHLIFRIAPDYESQVRNGNIQIEGWEAFVAKVPGAKISRVFPYLSSPLAKRGNNTVENSPNLRMIFYLSFDDQLGVEDVVRYMSLHPAVLYAEPWYLQKVFVQPNDLWADTTDNKNRMWHLEPIMAREAWDIERNDTTVVVGIVDSGTWGDHPDLQENVAFNYDDPIDGIDNDFDGYVDNYAGWDLAGPTNSSLSPGDNEPSIGNVHGLWVTGIIGATADNRIGVPGLCYNCKYLPIKGAADDAIGSISYGYQGIIYAIEQGADVVNCSWGGSGGRFAQDVIAYATQVKGAAIVAACGNSGRDEAYYPAAFPGVISVANSSFGDTLFSNSTFNYSVSLSAPGNAIASTFDDDDYWAWGGTSAASPIVAAAVALTKAHFPGLTAYQAAQRVRVTSDNTYDTNPAYVDKLGTGRVNMYRALTDGAKPSIRLQNYTIHDDEPFLNLFPGDSFALDMTWYNYLDSTQNLVIRLEEASESNYLEIIKGEVNIGKAAANDLFGQKEAFVFKLKENAPFDTKIYMKLSYQDSSMEYSDFEYISRVFNPTQLDVRENDLHTTLTSSGNLGFNSIISSREALGVMYKGRQNALFEAGFLISDGSGKVSDRLRNGQFVENDFRILQRVKREQRLEEGFQAITTFDDSQAIAPIGLEITHKTFASKLEGYENFMLLSYVIQNKSQVPRADIYAGLFTDWDISPYFRAPDSSGTSFWTSSNAASYNETGKYAYTYDVSGKDPAFYGVGVLSSHDFYTRALENGTNTPYTKDAKFDYLRTSPAPLTGQAGNPMEGGDVAQFVSAGPIDLFASQEDSLVFVLMASDSLAGLDLAMENAKVYYNCTILGKSPQNDFVVDPLLPQAGIPISFIDQNTLANSWAWDFGNGDSSSLQNPDYTYDQAGTYTVTLKVKNGICETIHTQTVEVNRATSLGPIVKEKWFLFPNPTSERIALIHPEMVNELAQIQWRNLHGQVIQSVRMQLNGARTNLKLPINQPGGIFYLELITTHHRKVLKVVLKP